MAILNNDEFETMQSNSSLKSELNRRMLKLESDTKVWIIEVVALHGTSHADDKASVAALRDELISKLTDAVVLP